MDQAAQHASVMAMDFVMDLEQNQARVDVAALATMLVRHAHPASVDLQVAIATRSVKKIWGPMIFVPNMENVMMMVSW